VFDFNDQESDENVVLYNNHGTDKMRFSVSAESDSELFELSSSFNAGGAWTHVVITVVDGVYSVWKDGEMAGYKADGLDPSELKRSSHLIGATAWGGSGPTNFLEGTIGYFRMWEGTEATGLTQDGVDSLFANAGLSGGGADNRTVDLGMVDSDGIEWSTLAVDGRFTATLPSGCPYSEVDSVVYAGAEGCSFGTAGSKEVTATDSDSPCSGGSVRCLSGTRGGGGGGGGGDVEDVGEEDCYGIPLYDNACGRNSDSWVDRNGHGCAWVAEQPRSRCTVSNNDDVEAWRACREACYCCDGEDPCNSKARE
jgi:hypothetical protein